ncbi:MAG TPA: hypothetical protein VJ583_06435 [Nitrososphaeraceae archaeon]|nr:hypothetical protein [Nitrososphaeraceae archaeon]
MIINHYINSLTSKELTILQVCDSPSAIVPAPPQKDRVQSPVIVTN